MIERSPVRSRPEPRRQPRTQDRPRPIALRPPPLFARRVLGALVLSLALAACSPPAPTEHAGHGTAVDVDPAARTITLDHGDIPGLMKGMTMTFAVAPDVDLEKVEKGAVVDFRLKSEGSAVTVIGIEPAESEGGVDAQP